MLQTIFKTCSSVLLRDRAGENLQTKIEEPKTPYLTKEALRNEIHEVCKNLLVVPNAMISMYGKKSVANSTGEIIPFVY